MNTPTEIDISGLRCYDKIVDDVTYSVPRGITRETRGRVWIVRVLKNKHVLVSARFTDLRFGGTRRALEAAIIHLIHSGHAWRRDDVLQLTEHATAHWRKRSGAGLCAVAYVPKKGPGRGETFFLSTYKRVASGRGLGKLRSKLVEVLENAHEMEEGISTIPYSTQKKIRQEVDLLFDSEQFQAFLEAGKRKADHIAVTEYIEKLSRDPEP
ncbi:hypothetical protein PSCICN_11390 [Pseudomonas cichorii]|uniref:Uncharacterized protein n=1 Tax=Pseudomonas serbiensis TaxID=3064350 RepID=A0ABT9CK87_9PSED|nr:MULTISPECIES: hypothetical protein [Pseudomonas]MDO7925883.1 hypothetical protein [Pseudomonas sp. KFB-138]GFM80447.1 hypothetical protein PSCICN_11390 [Pseudomonas cichorii]